MHFRGKILWSQDKVILHAWCQATHSTTKKFLSNQHILKYAYLEVCKWVLGSKLHSLISHSTTFASPPQCLQDKRKINCTQDHQRNTQFIFLLNTQTFSPQTNQPSIKDYDFITVGLILSQSRENVFTYNLPFQYALPHNNKIILLYINLSNMSRVIEIIISWV